MSRPALNQAEIGANRARASASFPWPAHKRARLHGSTQLPELCAAATGDAQGTLEAALGLGRIRLRAAPCQLAAHSPQFGVAPAFPIRLALLERTFDRAQCLLMATAVRE